MRGAPAPQIALPGYNNWLPLEEAREIVRQAELEEPGAVWQQRWSGSSIEADASSPRWTATQTPPTADTRLSTVV